MNIDDLKRKLGVFSKRIEIKNQDKVKKYKVVEKYYIDDTSSKTALALFKSLNSYVNKVKKIGNDAYVYIDDKGIVLEEILELDDEGLEQRLFDPRFFSYKDKNYVSVEKQQSLPQKMMAKVLNKQMAVARDGLNKIAEYHYEVYEVLDNGEEKLIEYH